MRTRRRFLLYIVDMPGNKSLGLEKKKWEKEIAAAAAVLGEADAGRKEEENATRKMKLHVDPSLSRRG